MNLLGALVAAILIATPSPTSTDWSIAPNAGETLSPLTGTALATLAPGASVEGEFTITHTNAIDGPVDITATTADPVTSLESHLLVTATLNGRAGAPVRLGSLLRDGAVARSGALLTRGPATLDVTVTMDPATTDDRMDSIAFTFFVTVSNEPVILPGQPGGPGSGSGSSSGGTAPGHGVPVLAYSGQAVSVLALVAGLALVIFGVVLLIRRRRRDDSPPELRSTS